jgi:hypothetical protein
MEEYIIRAKCTLKKWDLALLPLPTYTRFAAARPFTCKLFKIVICSSVQYDVFSGK